MRTSRWAIRLPIHPAGYSRNTSRRKFRQIVLHASGEFDGGTRSSLIDELHAAIVAAKTTGADSIVIDCSELTFIDAGTIHALTDLQRTAEAHGVSLVLHALTGHPERLVRTVQLWTQLCETPAPPTA
jgi:anti-anti-sigma factor